ncbi:MAG: hypothetical protein AAFR04_10890 [Pseudomonadota bacterium]
MSAPTAQDLKDTGMPNAIVPFPHVLQPKAALHKYKCLSRQLAEIKALYAKAFSTPTHH